MSSPWPYCAGGSQMDHPDSTLLHPIKNHPLYMGVQQVKFSSFGNLKIGEDLETLAFHSFSQSGRPWKQFQEEHRLASFADRRRRCIQGWNDWFTKTDLERVCRHVASHRSGSSDLLHCVSPVRSMLLIWRCCPPHRFVCPPSSWRSIWNIFLRRNVSQPHLNTASYLICWWSATKPVERSWWAPSTFKHKGTH